MLTYIPVVFEAYRLLKPRMWPVMQALAAHADRARHCWPSVRRIAEITGVPKSTVARYIRELERAGHLSRTWRKGGRCVYTIAAQFLPSGVSQHRRTTVPPARTEEKTPKKKEEGTYDWEGVAGQWKARVGSWLRSGGKFWLPEWGPKPSEPGCFAPPTLLVSHKESAR